MSYTIIHPLGPREGVGSFDTINLKSKHSTMEEALDKQEYVVINFVIDEENVIYFEAYHSFHPEDKLYQRLQIQHFPAGIDVFDDQAAMELAANLLTKYT